MQYLYHIVRDDVLGGTLYPLNVLKDKYPGQYKKHIKKYEGRERLLNYKVPILNCLWNDVIHLTAVYQSDINKALTEAGAEAISSGFYQIDPTTLLVEKTIVFLYKDMSPGANREFIKFNINEIEKYSKMRYETKQYYIEAVKVNKRPLLFHGLPHILYKGSINIKGLPIIF